MNASEPLQAPEEQFAVLILRSYQSQLEWTAPERTIHQCRDYFLSCSDKRTLPEFTWGLKFLLEHKFVRRLNDERLELTSDGRAWWQAHDPASFS